MSGAVSQSRRVGVADRFHGAARVRRTQHYVPRAAPVSLSSTLSEPHGQVEETAGKSAAEAFGRHKTIPCNLERFLEATMPSVPAQYLSKKLSDWRTCDEDSRTYFKLEDLWESFKESSAYGLGVPLMLNGKDSVVQYYVPYLSGIQLYADSSTQSLGPRNPVGGSDVDSFRDISSDGSSDSEMESGSKYSGSRSKNCISRHYMTGMNRLFIDDKHRNLRDGFSSDDSDCADSQGSLIFEYLENDGPYFREPLADKILNLAKQFPVLKTIRSCDLLTASWFSVAWYPIYRIPLGPTLTDLDACFLTFHFLSTPMKGTAFRPFTTKQKIYLPVFGLASLKCRSSLWTSSGDSDGGKLANTLFQAADKWLRDLKTNLPDYSFFVSRY